MPTEKGQIESVSQSYGNEPDVEDALSFSEYHVPLEDSIEIGQQHLIRNEGDNDISNKGDSDRSLNFSDMIRQDPNKIPGDNVEDRFPSGPNRKQRGQSSSQQSSSDESNRAPRRRVSGHSVSFKQSQGNYQEKATTSTARNNSPSRLRMEDNVVQISNDAKNARFDSSSTGNTDPMEQLGSLTESKRASLSWVDSDEGLGVDSKNSDQYGGSSFVDSIQGRVRYSESDFSVNTNASSPANFNPHASHNFSVASSDATFRMKPSSYHPKGATGLEGFKIPEENKASGASYDESDASFNASPGLKRRVKDIFNFRTISIFIVKLIPYICCIWCFKSRNELRGSSFPDRFILARLNILSFFFSAIQLAASLWLLYVMFVEGLIRNQIDDYQDQFNLWNNNAIIVLIGCFAFFLLGSCFWTTRIVKDVDLVGALRFLWLLLWILPIMAFLNITAFDFYEVTSIWIRHNWDSTQLWWFRNQFCLPDTDESLCLVPIGGGVDFDSEEIWCSEIYDSTDCKDIRDDAQKATTFFLLTFYRALASWGFAYMLIMLLIIKSLERIISKPMVQKSREVNVVGWLTFPVFCTALFGSIILFSPYTYIDKLVQPRWVGYLYLITSGLFFLALLMGWCLSAFSIRSNVDKQHKSNAALILVVVLFINAFVLLAIIMASFLWSRNLNITDSERGAIACTMNDGQCSNCDSQLPELVCPEWSFEEITSIVRRQLNQSAFMAAIFILYDLNVMVHGFNLRKHLSMYQIDYV